MAARNALEGLCGAEYEVDPAVQALAHVLRLQGRAALEDEVGGRLRPGREQHVAHGRPAALLALGARALAEAQAWRKRKKKGRRGSASAIEHTAHKNKTNGTCYTTRHVHAAHDCELFSFYFFFSFSPSPPKQDGLVLGKLFFVSSLFPNSPWARPTRASTGQL